MTKQPDDQLIEFLRELRKYYPTATTEHVQGFIGRGEIVATKIGRIWVVRRSAFDRLISRLMQETAEAA